MRKIIHVDMDCFFAAVEVRDKPHLSGLPVAVGGRPEKRGVIAACNYISRAFGVHSAMSSTEAFRRCPELQLLALDIERYREVSQQVRNIFYQYTPVVEPVSLDEAYLDVSKSSCLKGSATLIAQHIRSTIYAELGLTASAGVAGCKFLAKIASDENKPNGLCVIAPEDQAAFVKHLALSKIPGVGKVTYTKLKRLGWNTCEDIQKHASLPMLIELMGTAGEVLWNRCHGIDHREVCPHRETKSVSVETTFPHDICLHQDCHEALQTLLTKLYERLEKYKEKKQIASCRVKVTFSDFTKTTAEQAVVCWKPLCFTQLLDRALDRYPGKHVRLIGAGVALIPISTQLLLPL